MTSGLSQALWSKRPTYEEILRDMDTDYKVRLPDRVALQFYDSFAMTQFRERCSSRLTSPRRRRTNTGERLLSLRPPAKVWGDKAAAVRQPATPAEPARERGVDK